MHVKDYVPLEKLKKLVRSEKNPRVARRIQIIILALEGYTHPRNCLRVGYFISPCKCKTTIDHEAQLLIEFGMTS